MPQIFKEIVEFSRLYWEFLAYRGRKLFFRFELLKSVFAEALYKQRGKLARPFVHSGMVALSAAGIMLAPFISQRLPSGSDPWDQPSPSAVLSAATHNEIATQQGVRGREGITNYEVQEGDTVGGVAKKFDLTEETVIWQNKLTKKSILKPGQELEVLPVDGVSHKVSRGETIYSIAQKYSANPQAIVDFTFNTFVNDETFALAVGQTLIIPDGTPPKEAPPPSYFARRQQTPGAGAVTATGIFVWPASGNISQRFVWYHKGIDVANKAFPDVLAADSGIVEYSGCLGWGYGCHVIIDHRNGFKTLYAHLNRLYAGLGQAVARGAAVGQMGSTGRSTGPHLHFEIRQNGVLLNPLDFLR